MRKFLLVVCLSLCIMPISLGYAQDAAPEGTLNYGDNVQGELTDREFEVEYYFQGKAGEVVLATMQEPGYDEGVGEPALILLNPDFDVIASHDPVFGTAVIAAVLPVDGEYTLLATRHDGRAGEETGAYNLSLTKPESITPNLLTGTITNQGEAFYLVQATELFGVGFVLTQATFYADMSVYGISPEGTLEDVAQIDGDSLGGVVFVDPATVNFSSFIVTVEDLGFTFRESSAQYGVYLVDPLQVVPAE